MAMTNGSQGPFLSLGSVVTQQEASNHFIHIWKVCDCGWDLEELEWTELRRKYA